MPYDESPHAATCLNCLSTKYRSASDTLPAAKSAASIASKASVLCSPRRSISAIASWAAARSALVHSAMITELNLTGPTRPD
jgi:hypothetical protein